MDGTATDVRPSATVRPPQTVDERVDETIDADNGRHTLRARPATDREDRLEVYAETSATSETSDVADRESRNTQSNVKLSISEFIIVWKKLR